MSEPFSLNSEWDALLADIETARLLSEERRKRARQLLERERAFTKNLAAELKRVDGLRTVGGTMHVWAQLREDREYAGSAVVVAADLARDHDTLAPPQAQLLLSVRALTLGEPPILLLDDGEITRAQGLGIIVAFVRRYVIDLTPDGIPF